MPTLNWIGKDKIINHHNDVPFKLLEQKYAVGSENSDNMIIHGDNLYSLKSLLPKYEGQIDVVYIDPPYNTGEEKWVYNDNVNDPRIKKWLGEVVGKEGEDLSRHDKWLCMMYPRVKLIHKLLKEDGVFFASIGVDEVHNFRIILDEIFGRSNFLGMVVRRAKTTSFRGNYFAPRVDYLFVYGKNEKLLKKFRDDVDESQYKKVETEGPRKGERYGDDTAFYLSTLETRPNQRYFIECPDGELVVPPGTTFPELAVDGEKVTPIDGEGVWRWEVESYKAKRDLLVFKKTKKSPLLNQYGQKASWNIYTKIYLHDKLADANIPTELLLDFINRQGTKELKALGLKFDFPKPSSLVEQLIKYTDKPKDVLVLDAFGGSGSTAHAVMSLNNKDGGTRRFIICEMMDYAETLIAERCRRLINGYKKIEPIKGDFAFYELGEQILLEDGNINPDISENDVKQFIYYSETHQELDSNSDGCYMGSLSNTAYYVLYEKDNATCLNYETLRKINKKADAYVIYADSCTLPCKFMEEKH